MENRASEIDLARGDLTAKSGLRISIGGCLHDELAHHLDSLIDGSDLNVKIPHLATDRSNHEHGIHHEDSL